ncbi:WD40 repeat domain-containing protein, partial [Micromonospora ureilytica]|uniref:WD40 repeat domain-containing protein n=1 Tax=Micromonospora ureilytica TaxID=709868 RepID=UPI0034DECC17
MNGTPLAVTASDERALYVWDLATGKLRYRLTGHTGAVKEVACTVVNGRPVAVSGASDPRGARMWDLTTGAECGRFDGSKDWVYHLACTTMRGTPVVVTSTYFKSKETVRIWDAATRKEVNHWH